MNIFVLDTDPKIAAQMSCNKHVVKMIVETAQMLSVVMHKNSIRGPYKQTHANHPCTVWAGKSIQNYTWLYKHGVALCKEYTHRYGRIRKCQDLFDNCFKNAVTLPDIGLTPFAQAMPDQYRRANTIEAYRAFYIHEKAKFATWKNRDTPEWFVQGVNNLAKA